MTNGMTAFIIAIGGTSLVCYWLMTRLQNRAGRHGSAANDNSSYVSSSGSYDSGGSRNVISWFSSDNSSSDNSGTSDSGSDGGGGDSGGGGDGWRQGRLRLQIRGRNGGVFIHRNSFFRF